MLLHNLKDKANRIWNADEAGFPLCSSTGQVIALCNSKYSITGDTKQQIISWAAKCAVQRRESTEEKEVGRRTGEEEIKKRKKKREQEIKKAASIRGRGGVEEGMGEDHVILN